MNSRNVKTQADESAYLHRAGAVRGALPLLITAIPIVLFATAGFVLMMARGPEWTGGSADILALDKANLVPATEARVNERCPECGVIVSIRNIAGKDTGPGAAGGATAGNRDGIRVKTPGSYEITIRMADGSSRMIAAAHPVRWRTGERLILIAGSTPPHQ